MGFSKKIQKLPLKVRKIILFTAVAIIGIVLVWVWAKSLSGGLKGFQGKKLMEEFRIPSLQEKLKRDLPKLEIPGGLPGLETQ